MQRYALTAGEYTPWIRLKFRARGGSSVAGIVRFLLYRKTEFALCDAGADRSGESRAADQPAGVLRNVSGEAAGHVRDAGTGGRYHRR